MVVKRVRNGTRSWQAKQPMSVGEQNALYWNSTVNPCVEEVTTHGTYLVPFGLYVYRWPPHHLHEDVDVRETTPVVLTSRLNGAV
jgi:hypothetical protein